MVLNNKSMNKQEVTSGIFSPVKHLGLHSLHEYKTVISSTFVADYFLSSSVCCITRYLDLCTKMNCVTSWIAQEPYLAYIIVDDQGIYGTSNNVDLISKRDDLVFYRKHLEMFIFQSVCLEFLLKYSSGLGMWECLGICILSPIALCLKCEII